MVGRLVEDKHVGVLDGDAAEDQAGTPSANAFSARCVASASTISWCLTTGIYTAWSPSTSATSTAHALIKASASGRRCPRCAPATGRSSNCRSLEACIMTIAELHKRRDFAPVREVATTVGYGELKKRLHDASTEAIPRYRGGRARLLQCHEGDRTAARPRPNVLCKTIRLKASPRGDRDQRIHEEARLPQTSSGQACRAEDSQCARRRWAQWPIGAKARLSRSQRRLSRVLPTALRWPVVRRPLSSPMAEPGARRRWARRLSALRRDCCGRFRATARVTARLLLEATAHLRRENSMPATLA